MKGIIEQLEGEYAVVYVEDECINFPRRFLPEDIEEGTYLKIFIKIDHETVRESRGEAETLFDRYSDIL